MSRTSRLFRISLRSLLVLVTFVAIAASWFAHGARQRNAAFAAVRHAGGDIQMGIGESSQMEKWFGPELFGTVIKVDLRNGKADNDLLTHIAVFKELRGLDLSNADIDDDGVRRLVHLPLRELWLQSTGITDASADSLSELTTLDFLQLNATSLTDAFLERLQPMPNLNNLGLRGTRVTSVGMKYLPRHTKLNTLDVYDTQIDDSGVRHLVDCQSLTHVGLSMTKITNSVFESLGKLPNLTTADLSANRLVATEAVLAFESAYPKCDIEWYRK